MRFGDARSLFTTCGVKSTVALPEGHHFIDILLLLHEGFHSVEHPSQGRVLAAYGVVDGEERKGLGLGSDDTMVIVLDVRPNRVLVEEFGQSHADIAVD